MPLSRTLDLCPQCQLQYVHVIFVSHFIFTLDAHLKTSEDFQDSQVTFPNCFLLQ